MRLAVSDIFIFGIPEIDNGHCRITLMINEIGDCIASESFDSALRQVIHLIAVERKHANYENQLLMAYNYSALDDHKDYHRTLNASLNDIMESLGEGDFARSAALHNRLCQVFMDDLVTADLPFKSLLQDRVLNV